MRDSEVMTLPGGRVLSYAIYGSPVPRTTVFFFHAFPSSRKEGKLWHSAAVQHHIRFVTPDRPGIGNSTPQPNRTLLDWPKDVLALADHLKVERFYVMGLSGGCGYTLACVKDIPKERLAGAAVVSGLYPASFGTTPVLMTGRILLWVGSWMTGQLGTVIDMAMGKAARDPDPKAFDDYIMKEIGTRLEVDKVVLEDDINRDIFIDGTREAFRQDGQGVAWEARLYGSPWGFKFPELEVGEEGVPLTLWHGSDDLNCPSVMAKKAKELLPNAKLYMMDGEGHVSYAFRNQRKILGDLIGVPED
jgi:pimeloyl-ACP methyl ester carboxylesterase